MTTGGRRPRSERFVVCGDNSLAFHLARELRRHTTGYVTVVLPSIERNHGPRIKLIAGVDSVPAPVLNEDAFCEAKVAQASAVALVGQDDTDNLRDAFKINMLYPSVRLVIRLFDMNLVNLIKNEFPRWSVLSDAQTAARSFAAAALGGRVFTPFELRHGDDFVKLYPAERRAVADLPLVCQMVVTGVSGEPELLPGVGASGGGGDKDIVVAHSGATPDRREIEFLGKWRRPIRGFFDHKRWWPIRGFLDHKVKLAIFSMCIIVLMGWGVLAVLGHTGTGDAFYRIILDSLGAAEFESELNGLNRIFQVIVTLAGVSYFIPVITAKLVTEAVRSRYPELVRPRPVANHIVLVGLGKLGICVLKELRERGERVLCVDKDRQARGVSLARLYRVPVVFGDASEADILRDAYVDKCRALIVVTGSNSTNLTAALHGREIKKGAASRGREIKEEDFRVVLRLHDDELAQHLRDFKIGTTHSVPGYAAPVFAAEMLNRDILSVIPNEREELLISKVVIRDGSILIGKTSREVDRAREVQVIGVRSGDTGPLTLSSAPVNRPTTAESPLQERRFASGDTLIIASTRDGRGQVIIDSSPAESVSR
ncbi:MAG TPA: NAD-binding protein [Pseudonocardiaceae bacterium]|nr:NAD-binding protein [Pseudonocardiaceae bacterium]